MQREEEGVDWLLDPGGGEEGLPDLVPLGLLLASTDGPLENGGDMGL